MLIIKRIEYKKEKIFVLFCCFQLIALGSNSIYCSPLFKNSSSSSESVSPHSFSLFTLGAADAPDAAFLGLNASGGRRGSRRGGGAMTRGLGLRTTTAGAAATTTGAGGARRDAHDEGLLVAR